MTNNAPSCPALADPFYEPLKRFVIERTGLFYYDDRETDLSNMIRARLIERGLDNFENYLALLHDENAGPAELDALIASLTIGETHFFRHRQMFDAIREIVLPNVVERNRHCKRIRVWSAGCSIGAEAYSMSILIREFLGNRASEWDVSILGTDINREYLANAERGTFNDWALRSLSDDIRRRYFARHKGNWEVLPIYRRDVTFQYHNLVTHAFPSLVQNLVAFDIVLCRNVMIYFGNDVNRRLVESFYRSLVDEGWLLVGHSEPQAGLFGCYHRVLADGAVLYHKAATAAHTDTTEFHHRHAVCPHTEVTPRRADTPTRHPQGNAHTQKDTEPAYIPDTHDVIDRSLVQIRALADRGELENATDLCAKLLDQAQLSPKVNFHFALLLQQSGHVKEAEQWLRNVIALDHDFVLAHFYLGLTHRQMGDHAAARRAFENTLQLTEAMNDTDEVDDAEEMTVRDLRQLTETHLSLLMNP